MLSPVRINLRDTGNTEFTPSPYRWIVPDSAALPKTVAVDDVNKIALLTDTGEVLRISAVTGTTPTWVRDLSGGTRASVVTVADGVLNLNSGTVFKIPSNGTRSISITNYSKSNEMKTVSVLIEGAGAVTWPAYVNWVGGTAPKLGANYTLVVIAVFETIVVGQEVISV